jgi:hypothetical protein
VGLSVGSAVDVGCEVAVDALGDGVLNAGGLEVAVWLEAAVGVAVGRGVLVDVGVGVGVSVPDNGTVADTGPWMSMCPPISTASRR